MLVTRGEGAREGAREGKDVRQSVGHAHGTDGECTSKKQRGKTPSVLFCFVGSSYKEHTSLEISKQASDARCKDVRATALGACFLPMATFSSFDALWCASASSLRGGAGASEWVGSG